MHDLKPGSNLVPGIRAKRLLRRPDTSEEFQRYLLLDTACRDSQHKYAPCPLCCGPWHFENTRYPPGGREPTNDYLGPSERIENNDGVAPCKGYTEVSSSDGAEFLQATIVRQRVLGEFILWVTISINFAAEAGAVDTV